MEATSTVPPAPSAPGGPSFDDVYAAERAASVLLAELLVGAESVAEELAHDAFLRLL